MRFNTALLHGDFRGDKKTGATQTPVYQSSAFEHASAETLEKIFNNKAPGFSYSRISNPTVDAFERRMTALEGGIASNLSRFCCFFTSSCYLCTNKFAL